MKKVKRIVALAAATLLSMSVFAGCSNAAVDKGGANGEPVKLVWYTIGGEPKDLELVEAEANKYLKDKINAEIDMKFVDWGDYTKKLSVVINSGEEYDLAFTCSWAGDYLGNARKGAFLDLTPYLENQGKDMKAAIDQRFWDGAKIEDGIYAVPNQKELGAAPMWVFTKEYVEKYNIPYTELHTLQDLEPWLKVIKENEPDVVPLYITKGFSFDRDFDQLVDPVGVEFGDSSLTIRNIFESDKMKANLETLKKYYDLGYINADSATAQDDKSVKRLITKGDGQPYAELLWSKDLGYDVVASPITKTQITNGSTTGSMIAVSKTSKNPETAVAFLNLLNTDSQLRDLINYGVEGTHYTRISDKQIKLTDKSSDYGVPYFSLGNLFITSVLDNEPTTKWEEFAKFNNDSEISPALGFKFENDSVSNEIAAMNNVLEEFKATLYSGSVDPTEYLAKLNAKLKEQGIDKVITEMQNQINAWKK